MRASRARISPHSLNRLVATDVGSTLTDRELLRRFSNNRDEGAFESLVHRHAAMVLAVARRVLCNAHDAEDVCQAAFFLLARKAASHSWQPSVANWLHKTAHLLALKARLSAARRSRREGSIAERSPSGPLAEITGQELLAVLDEELLALPESLRAPLLLCYLEGATRDEAAERLNCPLSTLKKRLERGRDRLHSALLRRGLGLSSALLATLLVGQAATSFASTISRVTLASTAGNAVDGAISPQVVKLLEGGIGMTGWTKLKAVLGVLLVGGLVAAAGAVASNTPDDKPAQPPTKEKAAPEMTPEPPAQQNRDVRIIVLDPRGKPLAGAKIHASVWTSEKEFKANRDIQTDAEGIARLQLPKTYYIVRLWASKKPFVEMYAGWEQAELTRGRGLPTEYTFRLEDAVTASGRVVDEKGKPVAGARVEVTLASDPRPHQSDGRLRYNRWLAEADDRPTTDANGRWKINNLPNHPEVELHLLVTHPDYVADERWNAKTAGVTTKMFREGTATVTLKSGVIVRGRVTDPDGKPIKDALVIHGDDPYGSWTPCKFATDAEGRFRLPALPAGPRTLTVVAPGFAPQMCKLDLKPDLADQDFRMAAGKLVRLRIANDSGKPIPKAFVYLHEWKGSKSIYSDHNPNHPKVPDTGIPRRADAEGVWEWPSAPDDPVKVQLHAEGYASLEMEVTGGSTDRTVTMKPEHKITGAVTDAVTGKPIPNFTVIPVDVFRKDFLSIERFNAIAGKNGRLEYLARRTDIPLRLRIEAAGYRTQNGPEFRVGDDNRKQNFRLQPSPPRSGTVVDAAGKPVAKAEVLMATPTASVGLGDEFDRHGATTNEAGRFEFPDPDEPWAVIARTDAGVAIAEFTADRIDAGILKLQSWGSIRGTFSDGGKPVAGATVFVNPIRVDGLDRPRVDTSLQVRTDAAGRFDFPRVPPGPVSVHVHLGPWRDDGFRSAPLVPLDLKPGQKAELVLGSDGATLSGKVKLTGKIPSKMDCTYSLNYLIRREPGITPPPDVAAAGFDATKGWRDSWQNSFEGLAYLKSLRGWFVKLAPDGSFRVSGVPPGEYDLAVAVYAKPSGCLTDPLARRVVRVSVTAADVTRGEVKVPEIAAEVVPIPEVGESPNLTFKKIDGKEGTLAELRNKYTLIHFWASWCAPCKKQMPALKKLHERFAGRGLATIGLSLDDDTGSWMAAIKDLNLPWNQGQLAGGGAAGVSSVPAYWLLDPGGKIVAKLSHPDEVAKELEKRLK